MSLPPHPFAHTLCAALAQPRETPTDRADRLVRVPELFLDSLFIASQSEKGRAGFAHDLRWCAGLCRATWREEALWNGMVHVRRGWRKRTHLIYAVQRDDAARVRWLLARGAPTEDVGYPLLSYTACEYASMKGYLEVVRELIAAGANVNAANAYGRTALRTACCNGHVEVVRALLAAGADTSDVYSISILSAAASSGHVDVIRVLLAAGADATHVNRDGRTARQELTFCHPHLAWPAP
jgi:hypothetical protein